MSASSLSSDAQARIAQEIRTSLDRVLNALLAKQWSAAANLTALNEIYFKGIASPIDFLIEKANQAGSGRADLGLVILEFQARNIQETRADLQVRVAFTATKILDGSPDGIIVDLKLQFTKTSGLAGEPHLTKWLVSELRIDCPPVEHQWNNSRHRLQEKVERMRL